MLCELLPARQFRSHRSTLVFVVVNGTPMSHRSAFPGARD